MGRSRHSSSRSRSGSRSRSKSASKSRSRSRSRSHSRSRRRSRSRSPRGVTIQSQRRRNRSRSLSPVHGHRVHVADLGIDCTKREIQKEFEKYGPTLEVWMARNPPCFAFVVYERKEDAESAIKHMNGQVVCNYRVRVTHARPRAFGRIRPGLFNSRLQCYQCGERGHFSRDCKNLDARRRVSSSSWGERFVSYKPRSRRYSDHRDHSSRSPKKRARSRSRSRSPVVNGRRSSRSRSRSHSPTAVRGSSSQKKFRLGL